MRARTALAAALATAFLLAGCSATSGTDTAVEGGAPGVSNDMMVTEEMPAAEGDAGRREGGDHAVRRDRAPGHQDGLRVDAGR